MKRNGLLLLIPMLAFLLVQCENEEEEELVGDWTERSDFEGLPRSNAVCFDLNGKAYVGTGYDGDDYLSDFWEFDPNTNFWLRIADFPGDARSDAVGFSIGNKGYIGTGYNGDDKLNDFWEYDPGTNSWTRKADFAGSARYAAIGFSINDKGYIGTGYDGNELKDFWAYDPASDSWEQKVSVGGSKRRDGIGFVINGKGYVCTGRHNGALDDELWEYSPELDVWVEKEELDYDDEYAVIRASSVSFTLNGKAYVGTGEKGGVTEDIWEYDPVYDIWEQKTSFEGTSRMDAVGFSIDNVGYLTTGRSASYYFDDIWAFDPNAAYEEDD